MVRPASAKAIRQRASWTVQQTAKRLPQLAQRGLGRVKEDEVKNQKTMGAEWES